MKLAYLCYWNLSSGDGVARKIEGQARLWRAAGHEVEVVSIQPGCRREETAEAVEAVESTMPDLVYVRYDLFLPAVWRMVRRVPTVVEVNSDDRAEMRLRGFGSRAYNAANRMRLFRAARGVVCVTQELARGLAGPVAVIANGADPEAVPSLPAPSNQRPRAVFAGSPDLAWHGVDRLLELARAVPEVDVDLLGPRPAEVPANVTVHGTLSGDAYWDVLGRADVAVGSLAMERAGLTEGSPLKVREYLLAGIPTVIGYEDTDFPDWPWYLARFDGEDAFRRFVAETRGRRVPREEVEPRISWRSKEQQRLAFFESI